MAVGLGTDGAKAVVLLWSQFWVLITQQWPHVLCFLSLPRAKVTNT